jgi:hypothetical protein
MKNLLNRKLFELFELFDKKVQNYSLFDKFLIHYLNPSLIPNTFQIFISNTYQIPISLSGRDKALLLSINCGKGFESSHRGER